MHSADSERAWPDGRRRGIASGEFRDRARRRRRHVGRRTRGRRRNERLLGPTASASATVQAPSAAKSPPKLPNRHPAADLSLLLDQKKNSLSIVSRFISLPEHTRIFLTFFYFDDLLKSLKEKILTSFFKKNVFKIL